ncbi:MAG: phosphoribosylformylglycinamidine synthase subunit PurL [candidate division Zixibacteria bacterium]|nr:phosphoribosylformylglycinamidine synthase subunit PurL [candidate division Zixibacteria bacterium]
MFYEPEITPQLIKDHGLSDDEFRQIVAFLGRQPTFTELGIYSVMWSEHCSYKNSIAQLKTLPRKGKRLLAEAGEENAGAIDIGDGLAVVFKIESHNHPSAIEPYQGAATGMGGILRDIFTMGARPEAAMNSLRFGPLDLPQVRYLFDGVVRGIGDYGNCFGIPDVGGEGFFDESYTGNPLINAMALGIAKKSELISATAKGAGNPVLIVGSKTGRDGIHGATFASEELSEKSAAKRPSVQIGDPFTEKLLLEATLEVIKKKLLVGIQDMGAAGLTCSSSEMSARGKSGMELHIDRVPVREEAMTPYEIMLSESQERMLVVTTPEKLDEVIAVFRKWDLQAVVIGKVIDENRLKVYYDGKLYADIPPDSLVLGGKAPVYIREQKKPKYIDELAKFNPLNLPEPRNYNAVLKQLIASPDVASKRWVYRQYDTSVRTATVIGPGGDAAVIRVRKSPKGIAMSTDGNGRWCYLNPRLGAIHAVCESAINVACCGAMPIGITNCLNFGNPYVPEIYYTFAEVIAGIGEACRALDTPVTGGNVSFYNESYGTAVYPTPVIGMVGVLDDVTKRIGMAFTHEGDRIAVIGDNLGELGGSEYLKTAHKRIAGAIPSIDLGKVNQTIAFLVEAASKELLKSAHDVSDGGLAVALAECCFQHLIGAFIYYRLDYRPDACLFGESRPLVIISYEETRQEEIEQLCAAKKLTFSPIGITGGEYLNINELINCSVHELRDLYEDTIPRMMDKIGH